MLAGNYSAKKIDYFSLDTDNAKINHRKKTNGEVVITPYAFIEGILTDIEATEWVFEKKPILQVKLTLKSPQNNEDYGSFECGRTSVFGRDLLNKLANIDSIQHVRITPWLSDEVDGQRFTHCAIKHNGEKIKNKFDKTQFPAPEMVEIAGEEFKSTKRRDNFFSDLIPVIKSKIAYKEPAPQGDLKPEDFVEREEINF